MRIKIVLAAGLASIAVAVLAVLSHSPETVAATNGVAPATVLMTTTENAEACQADETIPAGTNAIRLQMVATTGPRVSIRVLQGSRQLTQGAQGPAWYGAVVTVPVPTVQRTARHARVCFQLRDVSGEVRAYGSPSGPRRAARANGKPLPGRVTIYYLHTDPQSWLSLAGGVIEHMQLGRAASGGAIVVVIAVLAAAAIGLGAWTASRELG